METLQQFQPDYIISWDFSYKDAPCVSVCRLERGETGTRIEAKIIGSSYKTSGCVSLRQVIEDCERREREETERSERLNQRIKKASEAFANVADSAKKATEALKENLTQAVKEAKQ